MINLIFMAIGVFCIGCAIGLIYAERQDKQETLNTLLQNQQTMAEMDKKVNFYVHMV